jgi:TonB family protein
MFKSIFLIAQIVGVIAGKVVNSTTGEGIPSASVFVEGTTLGASTDKNGIYFIKDVPVGRYTLIATAVGFEVVKLSVVVMPDEVATVNFNLTPKTDERVRETAFGERYFDIVEEMPEIIGGLESIQRNLVYPETAIRAGVQGTVLVMAFVDENGNVERAEVVRGIGAGCDEAAVSAVMKVKFKPGKLNGKPVKARVLIPINFKLRAKQIQKSWNGVIVNGGLSFPTGPQEFSDYWNAGYTISLCAAVIEDTVVGGLYFDYSKFSLNSEKFLSDLKYPKYGANLSGGDIQVISFSLGANGFFAPSAKVSLYFTLGLGIFSFFRSKATLSNVEVLEESKIIGLFLLYGGGLGFKIGEVDRLMFGVRKFTGWGIKKRHGELQILAGISLSFQPR